MSTPEGLTTDLFRVGPAEYGAEYRAHLLEQYRLYVEMADRVSARRLSANTFFLSVNTAVLAFLSAARQVGGSSAGGWILIACIAGGVLCFTWYRLIRSYRDLNSGKFRVIHAVEQRLPVALYGAEWTALSKGKDRKLYWPLTHIEVLVPWIFLALYAILASASLLR